MQRRDPGDKTHLLGGAAGCLVLCGADGAAQALPLAEEINRSGFTVSVPHPRYADETSGGAAPSNWRTWLDDAREAFSRLDRTHAPVAVVGIGVGGALALILAAEYPVSAVAVISPALRLAGPMKRLLSPACSRMPGGRARARGVLAVARLARRSLFAVVAPVFVVQPEAGERIRPAGAKLVLSGVSSGEKHILWLTQGCHDYPSGGDFERVVSAIKYHLRRAAASIVLEN